MGIISIPVRLSLTEISAVALAEAADDLSAAADAGKFVTALDANHRLWLALTETVRAHDWAVPDNRTTEFVTATTCHAGRAVKDEQIETLLRLNRTISAALVDGRPLDPIRNRAKLAWEERTGGTAVPMLNWLIVEMDRKRKIEGINPDRSSFASCRRPPPNRRR